MLSFNPPSCLSLPSLIVHLPPCLPTSPPSPIGKPAFLPPSPPRGSNGSPRPLPSSTSSSNGEPPSLPPLRLLGSCTSARERLPYPIPSAPGSHPPSPPHASLTSTSPSPLLPGVEPKNSRSSVLRKVRVACPGLLSTSSSLYPPTFPRLTRSSSKNPPRTPSRAGPSRLSTVPPNRSRSSSGTWRGCVERARRGWR